MSLIQACPVQADSLSPGWCQCSPTNPCQDHLHWSTKCRLSFPFVWAVFVRAGSPSQSPSLNHALGKQPEEACSSSTTLFIPVSGTLIIQFPIYFYPSFRYPYIPVSVPALSSAISTPAPVAAMHSSTVPCPHRQNTTQQWLTRMYYSPLASGH